MEEVGLYVCVVRGGVLTVLTVLYSGEIKIKKKNKLLDYLHVTLQ